MVWAQRVPEERVVFNEFWRLDEAKQWDVIECYLAVEDTRNVGSLAFVPATSFKFVVGMSTISFVRKRSLCG